MSDPTKSHKQRPTSQESKVTSTPTKRKRSSEYSPDLSSIHNEDDPANEPFEGSYSSFDSTYVNQNEINSESSDSASDVDESAVVDSLEDILKTARLKKTGNYWRTIKPIREDTIYYLLLSKPNDSEGIALEFLQKFKTNAKFCVNSLLKLFLDVSGYQKLEIESIYNFAQCNAQEAVDLLTTQLPEQIHIETNSFLLDDNQSQASTIIKRSLYFFLETLIVNGHTEEVLYNDTFVVHVFNFIRWMAFSTLRPIRATGIIFSLKFMTGCCKYTIK